MLFFIILCGCAEAIIFYEQIPLMREGNCWTPVKIRKPIYCTNKSMTVPALCPCDNDDRVSPLPDCAHSQIEDEDGFRWQMSKKDEELAKLQMTLKNKEQDFITMKAQVAALEVASGDADCGTLKGMEMQQLLDKLNEAEDKIKTLLGQRPFSNGNVTQNGQIPSTACPVCVDREESEELDLQEITQKSDANAQGKEHNNMTPHIQLQTPIRTSPSPSSPMAVGGCAIPPDMLNGDADSGTSKGVEVQQLLDKLNVAEDKIKILEGQQPFSNGNVAQNGQIFSSACRVSACPICVEIEDSEQRGLQEMKQKSDANAHGKEHNDIGNTTSTTIMPRVDSTQKPIQCQAPEPCQCPEIMPTECPPAAATTMMTCECLTTTIHSTTPTTTAMATTAIMSECPHANTYIGAFMFWFCSAISGVVIQWFLIIYITKRRERRRRFNVKEEEPQAIQMVNPAEISDLFARMAHRNAPPPLPSQATNPPPPPSPAAKSDNSFDSSSTIIDQHVNPRGEETISLYENENPRDLLTRDDASISVYYDV